MKKNAIIMVQEARSHILPALYLANLLKDEYEFVFCLNSDKHLGFVEENGFKCLLLKSKPIGYFEDYRHIARQKRSKNKLRFLSSLITMYFKNSLFAERQREIDAIVEDLVPDLVFIDLFASTNLVFFYRLTKKHKVLFFSPMLSVHPQSNTKRLNEGNAVYFQQSDRRSLLYRLKVRMQIKIDELFLRKSCRKAGLLQEHPLTVNYPIVQYHFENVPELILAPGELELKTKGLISHQHYLGLCTYEGRSEAEIDKQFDLEMIKSKKAAGQKILFCVFGTYFRSYENHMAITGFITNLITAVTEMRDVQLIVGVNKNVISVLQSTLPEAANVQMFQYLPQLEMLKISDVFINHGGLGSIKEGIQFEVPMLVYPLDFRWDNIGNAYKVHQHGLGLERELRNNTPEEIRCDLQELLTNKSYKEKLRAMNWQISKKYTSEKNKDLIKYILK